MRIVKGVLGALVAFVFAAVVTAYAGLHFVAGTCGTFNDTGGPFPADDSPQGRVCGFSDDASWLEAIAPWSIPLAGVVAVVVAVIVWRRGTAGRWVAALTLLLLPLAPLLVLGLPSDACSPAVARQPGSVCETGS